MSDEEKKPPPPPPPRPFVVNPNNTDLIAAIAEEERQRRAVMMSGPVQPPFVPPRSPIMVQDDSSDAEYIAILENHRRRSNPALFSTPPAPPPDDFPVLVSQAVIIPYETTFEGELIRAVTIPLLAIIKKIMQDPLRLYGIDPRKLEEIIAATYAESGLFDEVTLTPRSGDRGKDLIAVKKGFGSVRIVESVKRYTPGHVVTAEEVDALIGVMNKQPQTSKGVISTTWEFAPKIMDDPDIARLIPTRLELVNGTALVQRLKEYAKLKG